MEKVNFCNVIRNAGGKVSDIFVIFNYGIFPDKILKQNKLKLHFLTDWKSVINLIKSKKIFKSNEIKLIEDFLYNANK